jgi:hypothetical protein
MSIDATLEERARIRILESTLRWIIEKPLTDTLAQRLVQRQVSRIVLSGMSLQQAIKENYWLSFNDMPASPERIETHEPDAFEVMFYP